MAIAHITIEKTPAETSASTLRRFTKKVQESRLLQKVKGQRYASRKPSKTVVKKAALRRLVRAKEIERLKKLGKVPEVASRSGR